MLFANQVADKSLEYCYDLKIRMGVEDENLIRALAKKKK